VTTRTNWVTNVAAGLTNVLPRLTTETSKSLVETYLNDVAGGWDADNTSEPNGSGTPNNEISIQNAVRAIEVQEIQKLQTITVTIPVNIKFTLTDSYDSELSEDDIIESMETILENKFENHLFDTNVSAVQYNWSSPVTTNRDSGILTPSDRVNIQSDVNNGDFSDPAASALHWVRTMNSVDETYMATQLYSNPDMESVCIWIKKFTDINYDTLDGTFIDGEQTVTRAGYAIFVNKLSGKVQDALVHPIEIRSNT